MADSLVRLKIDSQEYDQKLKRATEGLQRYVEGCRKVGGTLEVVEKDTLDYVKALGQMDTVSRTATGKLAEMKKAFTELSVQYKQLTDEEKQSPFGLALASSLDQLKSRCNEAKKQLDSVNAELGNTKQAEDGAKSGLEGLTSALGINVKSLAGWGAALAAGKVALDVAKDAFFASEANVDEWGRTIQSAQSVYEGFLISINNGDISGFLSRMDDIVKAARAAYNELDTLGTMKTIQAPQVSAQQTENERIRSMIQTGRYIAPIDGRRNAVFNGREMQNGDKLTAGQIRALEKQLQNGMQNVVKLVGNEVKQTGKAINAYYDSIAKQNGMSLQEFKKGTSTWEEFSKKMQGYEQYKEWDKQARTEFAKQGGRGNVDFDKSNPFAEFRKWGTFRVDKMGENSYNDLVRLIQQRDQQAGQAYGMQSQAYRTMNRAEGFTVSKLMGNGGTGNKNKKEYDDLQKVQQEIAKLTKEAYTADSKRVEEIQAEIAGLQEEERRLTAIRDLVTNKNNDPLKAIESQFPDMSKQNYNTGYAGSAQAKYDSARADLALGPTNLDAVNTYISSVKGMLKDANLGDELYNRMTEKLKDATTVSTLLQEMMERGLAGADLESTAQALKEKLLSPEGIDQTAIQSFLDELNKQIEEAGGVGLKLNADTGEVTDDKGKDKGYEEEQKKFNEGIGKLTGGLSQVAGGLKSVGIELPKEVEEVIGVINGVSQIISGVGTIISVFGTSAITANTTAVGLNTAAIAGLIAAIEVNTATNIIPFFAGGGIVPAFAQGGLIGRAAGGLMIPGNSMSGDRLRLPVDGGLGMIGVNSGELILNRAQQGNLASQLEGGGIGNLHLDTVISAEDIRLILNNNGRRTGRGEYVTTRNSRT
jgi:archaellum component FlaC